MTIELNGGHYIQGRWHQSGEHFHRMAAASNQALPEPFYDANDTDVDAAVTAAEAAFWLYQQKSAAERAELLDTMAEELLADGAEIVAMAMLESALPQARLQGELGRTCNQLRLFAAALRDPMEPVIVDRAQPERTPLPKPDMRLGQLPLGPVAVFGASNFPLAFSTPGGDTASALAAGCSVVVKGHPAHPGTSELCTRAIARAIEKCDMPQGLFSLLQGHNPGLSTALVSHGAIKAIGFTGSLKVGRILADCCAARAEPIPFYGELGSINPQLLLPGMLEAHAEQLAQNQVTAMLLGQGQFCTNPGLLLAIKGPGLERFIATASNALAEQGAGAMLTAGIANAYRQGVESLLPQLELLAQGQAIAASHQTRPTLAKVSGKALLANPALRQEIFGPFALLAVCDSADELLNVISALEGQLSASVHGLEEELADFGPHIQRLAFKVGRLIFNQAPTGVEVCHAMQHGGPYPASTDSRSTSVGSGAMKRFLRPICYQNMPQALLPEPLKDGNPMIWAR
ncbi:aldehyde dehydrogenase (NADP(+)) [Shewanella cyperi]|uniref:Aldehyde dehydrogenase (NADP(+)) n=1 Tax=Shewanella cyperi TaxID=2814292 RepID=A0A974XHY6_9GAMM|nr:aldehyde dehydrogenase (NADP(+)) [Shewanella cyperi]QSX28745.1 aldehyde dehydrogenase (NADP(+)) [Shewanella cyperi]